MTRPIFKDTSTHRMGTILATLCDEDTLAGVIDCLLSADAEPRLCDVDALAAQRLFERLCELRPDCVIKAQARAVPQ